MSFLSRFRSGAGAPTPVLLDDPAYGDADLAAVRDAATRDGDWKPVAELLEVSAGDWDVRGTQVNALAKATTTDSRWLDSWLAAEPDAPDALAVRSAAQVRRAWQARAAGRARQASDLEVRELIRFLDEAATACEEAIEANPDDPTPWSDAIRLAIEQEEPRSVFESRWAELTTRDPHNRIGHDNALEYNCAKWHGSHELMYAFAREVVERAPEGSPLVVLLLQAHVEYDLAAREEGFWQRPEVTEDIDLVLAKYRAGEPHTHALAPHDLSVLAFVLTEAERWEDAAEQFTAAEHRMYEYPWLYRPYPTKHLRQVHAKAFR
jgi:hypothetical protein